MQYSKIFAFPFISTSSENLTNMPSTIWLNDKMLWNSSGKASKKTCEFHCTLQLSAIIYSSEDRLPQPKEGTLWTLHVDLTKNLANSDSRAIPTISFLRVHSANKNQMVPSAVRIITQETLNAYLYPFMIIFIEQNLLTLSSLGTWLDALQETHFVAHQPLSVTGDQPSPCSGDGGESLVMPVRKQTWFIQRDLANA